MFLSYLRKYSIFVSCKMEPINPLYVFGFFKIGIHYKTYILHSNAFASLKIQLRNSYCKIENQDNPFLSTKKL